MHTGPDIASMMSANDHINEIKEKDSNNFENVSIVFLFSKLSDKL